MARQEDMLNDTKKAGKSIQIFRLTFVVTPRGIEPLFSA